MKKIECVIMDWAGSAVDYGCFAPVAAFIGSFANIGITITAEDARKPMGQNKLDHIRALFAMPHVDAAFGKKYGRKPADADVQARYADFKQILFATLADYTDPIPGVVDTINALKDNGIKIGSTTGYTDEMMRVVVPAAAAKGYRPDNWVTADNLPAGRPSPYMIYRNMCDLAVPSCQSVVKFGDTIADIREGVNAGVWSVGVVMGSNELGLAESEAKAMPRARLDALKLQVRMRMYAAGAHYVVDNITQLPGLIDAINGRMSQQ